MVDFEKIITLQRKILEILDDLLATMLIDEDGKLISSAIKEEKFDINELHDFEEKVLKSLGLIKESEDQSSGTFTFDTDEYRLVFSRTRSNSILIFIAEKASILDILFPYIYLCAEKISRIHSGRNISLIIPDFYSSENILKPEDTIGSLIRLGIENGSFSLKFILGGDSGVGKTTLVTHFVDEKLENDFKSTIGVSIMAKTIHFREWKTDVNLSIYDAAGQKQFETVRKSYFQNARLGFLVFDVTNRDSFENIQNWYREAKNVSPNVMLVLIGNKVDLIKERKVSKKEGKILAKKYNMQYLETSALLRDLVNEAFRTICFVFIFRGRLMNIYDNKKLLYR